MQFIRLLCIQNPSIITYACKKLHDAQSPQLQNMPVIQITIKSHNTDNVTTYICIYTKNSDRASHICYMSCHANKPVVVSTANILYVFYTAQKIAALHFRYCRQQIVKPE